VAAEDARNPDLAAHIKQYAAARAAASAAGSQWLLRQAELPVAPTVLAPAVAAHEGGDGFFADILQAAAKVDVESPWWLREQLAAAVAADDAAAAAKMPLPTWPFLFPRGAQVWCLLDQK
jgi:hypothetical protein